MAMEALQQRKRFFCDCSFEVTGLSDYHTAQHKQSKRHKQALSLAVSKMRRLDSYFAKPAVAREETAMETGELNNTLEPRPLGEYHS